VKVRYSFRIYPNEQQRTQLAKEFGTARYAYNFALNWWGKTFKDGNKPNYVKASAEWTKERHRTGWASQTSCIPPQQAIRHLQTAFKNFFEKRAKYPSFKKKSHTQTAEYTASGFKYDPKTKTLTISKVGKLDVVWTRRFQSEPTTVTITKKPSGKYFVTLCLDEADPLPMPKTGKAVGVDLGINRLATLSDGETVANPKYTAKYAKQLAKAQRILSRRTKGSNRWRSQRIKVARIQEKIANGRKDTLDKLTYSLCQRFDDICIEDLAVRNMVRNRRLSKAISDASFGMFKQMLEYKTRWYGKNLWVVDRFFPSSKTCSECGYIVDKLPLDVRAWDCPQCSKRLDRDINAARNILAVGRTVAGRGLGVRPKRTSVRLGNPRRSVNLGSVKTVVS